jgi:hypothetical protein
VTRVLFLLALVGCDKTERVASKYLLETHKVVLCEKTEGGLARCIADGVLYRCVVSNHDGCSNSHGNRVACERATAEAP